MVREPFGFRRNGTQTVCFSAQWYANLLVLGTMVCEPPRFDLTCPFWLDLSLLELTCPYLTCIDYRNVQCSVMKNFTIQCISVETFIHNFYRLYVTPTTLLWTLSTLSTLQARCRHAAGWLHSVQSAYSLQNPMVDQFVQLNTKYLSVELNWWNFAHT